MFGSDLFSGLSTETPPDESSDLMPTRLYAIELLCIPIFWLTGLLAIIFGITLRDDMNSLRDSHEASFDNRRLWYVLLLIGGHIVTFEYRFRRHKALIESRGFDRMSFVIRVREETPMSTALKELYGLKFGLLLLVMAVPSPALLELFLVVLICNTIIGPLVVFQDCRILRRDGILWGWTRFVHISAAAIPFGAMVYFVQRWEHTTYSKLVEYWDADPNEFQPATPQTVGDKLRYWATEVTSF